MYRKLKDQVAQSLREKGMTQAELADALGLSTSSVSWRTKREHTLSAAKIEEMAHIIGVDPTDWDAYVRVMLPKIAYSAPKLLDLGRSLMRART